jgi:hypothetical protein
MPRVSSGFCFLAAPVQGLDLPVPPTEVALVTDEGLPMSQAEVPSSSDARQSQGKPGQRFGRANPPGY